MTIEVPKRLKLYEDAILTRRTLNQRSGHQSVSILELLVADEEKVAEE